MRLIKYKQEFRNSIGTKGFAVSGILYPILILTLFLVVQILTMMATRKAVLDKNKQQLLDSVNRSNKIYTNEELSILVGELQTKNQLLERNVTELKTENTGLKNTLNTKLNLSGGTVSGDLNINGRVNSMKFKNVFGDFTTDQFINTFRTLMQGDGTYAPFLTTFRKNGTVHTTGAPAYGSGLAFSGGHDTHGYIYTNYNEAEIYAGSGNHDKLNWIRKITLHGDIYTVASDKRLKYDIEDITEELVDVYMEIKPVLFKYKKEKNSKIYTGVIAQQVMDVFKKHGLDYKKYGIIDTLPVDVDGVEYYSVNYENLDTLTMLVTQWQQKEIKNMKKKFKSIEQRLAKLENN